MKLYDLSLNIDGLILNDNETIEDYINKIQEISNTIYDVSWEILHEEQGIN